MPARRHRYPPDFTFHVADPIHSIQEWLQIASQGLVWLLLVWTWAAFGEEVGYRGYLLTRAADLGGRTTAAYWVGVVVIAILFGYGHYYKGPIGILDSGVAGLILGAAYMFSGRNLWASILAHGFIDTFAVAAAFVGWDF